MITPTQMYWLTRLDALNALGIAIAVTAGGIMFVGLVLAASIAYIDDSDGSDFGCALRRLVKTTVPIALIGLLVAIFVPSTKEAAAIIVIPAIANSEKAQNVGSRLYDLAVDWMDGQMKRTENVKGDAK